MNDRIPILRRLCALLASLCLITAGGAARAEDTVFAALQPLMDLTASAALRVGETPEAVTPGGTLSEAFVYNFFLLGQQAGPALGITAEMLGDVEAQRAYLANAFAATPPALTGILNLGERYDYIGVRVMAADESDDGSAIRMIGDLYQADKPLSGMTESEYAQVRWLDKRAVVEMHRDEAAPGGWKLYAFSVDAELQMEDAAQAYFTQTMVEYISTDCGFSLQYPAVFTEDTLKETADGVSATLKDGTASFFAKRMSNESGWTLSSLLDAKKQENPDAETNMNEISGCVRLVSQRSDGSTQADVYIVTEAWIYQAQLVYSPALASDFALYSDYMMNSFTASELGMG